VSTTSGTETAEVLQALTLILEHADALRARGCSPRMALGIALLVYKPRLGLALVAKAAWALAVGTNALSTTLRRFNDGKDPGLSAGFEEVEDDASSRPRSPLVSRHDPAVGLIRGGTGIEHRDVDTADLAANLRSMLSLPHHVPAPGEAAAMCSHAIPSIVRELDVGGWIAWCLAGLPLFSGPLPPLRVFRRSCTHVPITLAMLRAEGDIHQASRVLHVRPRELRATLGAIGLWPWRSRRPEATDRQGGS